MRGTTLVSITSELVSGRTTSRALVEQALTCIADQPSPGFLKVYAENALAEADVADRLRAAGMVRSPIDGVPVSVKDLFDVEGDETRAGSFVLARKALADAPAVARLRAAGAIILAKTSMTEFAFGGVGTNPHWGTPTNPADRTRVAGGSSTGAAVGVAEGIVPMGLGTDTRGSVRIPAALCGTTGFKPTQMRVPREGAFPLSYTLDSVGPVCHSVACCAVYDAILAADGPAARAAAPQALNVRGLRLMVPRACYLFDDVDATVGPAFERAVTALEAAGAVITAVDDAAALAPLVRGQALFAGGGFAASEAFQIHRELLASNEKDYDPNVRDRIRLGEKWGSGADYVQLVRDRSDVIDAVDLLLSQYDAMLCPTTPIVAPTIAEATESAAKYAEINLRLLRNPGIANIINGCSLTLPCHNPSAGELPVGLMLVGRGGTDKHLLSAGLAVEAVLAAQAVPAN